MDTAYAIKYYKEEQDNWWFVSRRNTILKLLDKTDRSAKIIDIGCSGGALLAALKEKGFKNIYGIDVSNEAINRCIQKGLGHVFVMDGADPQFEAGTFDLIISSDSLEHLEDDKKALDNWSRLLRPGGQLIVFVPAFMFLWSEHDEVNHHYRRYTSPLIKEQVASAGFRVLRTGYWNGLMFIPTFIYRISQKIIRRVFKKRNMPAGQLKKLYPFVNTLLIKWLSLEDLFFLSGGLIIGVSAFVHAQKETL